jgi:hypothetical protein
MRKAIVLALAAILISIASQTRADFVIQTPAGIAPGGSFIVVFVDNASHFADSTSIGTYNNFIATDAAGITYNGTIGSWSVLGATSAVNNATALLASNLPIYDTQNSGTLLASSGATLLSSSIGFDQSGISRSDIDVWTGLTDTASNTDAPLGTESPLVGVSGFPLDTLGLAAGEQFSDNDEFFYGFATFTAPTATPEPATFTTLVTGFLAFGGLRLRRRRSNRPLKAIT